LDQSNQTRTQLFKETMAKKIVTHGLDTFSFGTDPAKDILKGLKAGEDMGAKDPGSLSYKSSIPDQQAGLQMEKIWKHGGISDLALRVDEYQKNRALKAGAGPDDDAWRSIDWTSGNMLSAMANRASSFARYRAIQNVEQTAFLGMTEAMPLDPEKIWKNSVTGLDAHNKQRVTDNINNSFKPPVYNEITISTDTFDMEIGYVGGSKGDRGLREVNRWNGNEYKSYDDIMRKTQTQGISQLIADPDFSSNQKLTQDIFLKPSN